MRLAFGCGLLVACAAAAFAGGVQVAGPSIVVEPKKIDIGRVNQETEHHATITIRNDGTEVLEISGIKSDCGCTVASLPDSSLAPGESTTLDVTLSTRHFSGHIVKNVDLTTNDPAAPKVRVTLTADVRFTVRVIPPDVDFGAFPRGATPVQKISLRSALADSLHILRITLPEERFTSNVRESTDGDTLVQVVTFTARADAPVGPFRDTAAIETSHKLAKTLRIQLEGQVQSFFAVEPADVKLGQVRQGEARERTVTLRGTGAGRHRVLRTQCSESRIATEVKPLEEGRLYEIIVRVPADMPAGKIDAVLRVTTDDPDQSELRIPVRGAVRRARSEG